MLISQLFTNSLKVPLLILIYYDMPKNKDALFYIGNTVVFTNSEKMKIKLSEMKMNFFSV